MTRASPILAFLAQQARRQRYSLVVAAVAGAAAAGGATLLLGLSGWFLAGAAAAGAGGALMVQAFNYLLPSAGLRAFAIARTAGRYGERLYSHQAALRALAALRPALFGAIAAAPPQKALALASGEASTRLVQDVDALEAEFVRRPAPWSLFAGSGAAAVCVALASPLGTLVLIAGLAVQIAVGRRFAQRWTAAPALAALEATGRLKSGLGAYAAAAAELQVFGLTDAAVEALMAHDTALGEAGLRRAGAEADLGFIEGLAPALTLALIAVLCRGVPAPRVALALLAVLAGFEAAAGLLRAAEQTGAFDAAVGRLDETVDAPASSAAPPPADAALFVDGVVLTPGDRLALVGPSGCGKTRTLEALIGLRASTPGRLRVAGAPLEGAPAGWARPLFAYAPQDARMLTGTVEENLRIAAPDAAEDALWAALDEARLAARVRRMPEGLRTWIGDGGETLSGGERRRLALARAYLRPAPWLVLDEPTEGLDAATEAEVVEALRLHLQRTGRGLLLVSHRTAPLGLCPRRLDVSGSM